MKCGIMYSGEVSTAKRLKEVPGHLEQQLHVGPGGGTWSWLCNPPRAAAAETPSATTEPQRVIPAPGLPARHVLPGGLHLNLPQSGFSLKYFSWQFGERAVLSLSAASYSACLWVWLRVVLCRLCMSCCQKSKPGEQSHKGEVNGDVEREKIHLEPHK